MDSSLLSLSLNASGKINWPGVLLQGTLSGVAYSPIEEIRHQVASLGFREADAISHESMFGFVAKSEHGNALVFRGSEKELSDWMTNFDINRRDTTGGFVHRGFYEGWNGLKQQVESLLNTHPSTPLWVTGHSLGGAIAAIAAYEMECDGRGVSGLVTFGQPRIAGPRLARAINQLLGKRYQRVVNGNDVVPLSPPYIRDGKRKIYCHHTGHLVWMKDGKVKRNSFMGRIWRELTPRMSDEEFEQIHKDPRSEQQPYNSLPSLKSVSPIGDHFMTEYISTIRKHLA